MKKHILAAFAFAAILLSAVPVIATQTNVAPTQSESSMSASYVVIDYGRRGVRIRTAPNLRSGVVGYANGGDAFLCAGYAGEFYKIYYGGRIRYVSKIFSHME